jgi:hypothetical protein
MTARMLKIMTGILILGLPLESDAADSVRLARLEFSVAETKHSVDKILNFLQEHIEGSPKPLNFFGQNEGRQTGNGPPVSEDPSNMPDFPPLARVQDDLNKSAPILMVRKYRSSTRRLYKEEGRDIIAKQILSEDIAHRLFSKYESLCTASSTADMGLLDL